MYPKDIALFNDLLMDLQKETDRGLALVGAAFLDDRLKLMLAAYLRGDPKDIEQNLLRFEGPLGQAKARLLACHALGLITDREKREIGLIFEIRNQFSHKTFTQTFEGTKDDRAVPNKVDQLTPDLPGDGAPSRRGKMVMSVVEMWMMLWYRDEWIKRVRTEKSVWQLVEEAQAADRANEN